MRVVATIRTFLYSKPVFLRQMHGHSGQIYGRGVFLRWHDGNENVVNMYRYRTWPEKNMKQ